jgi:transaldolase/glucose-6-phosphate isomerase
MPYVERTDAVHAIFHRIRTNIRATTQVATTLGYDPRFLHSVGQLHKGGPNPGVFIQVIGDAQEDLSIPGEPYSFGVLKAAQTLGDMQRQTSRHRRVIRLYLWADVEKALACREQLIAPSMGLHAH